jgi:hypothetical protein
MFTTKIEESNNKTKTKTRQRQNAKCMHIIWMHVIVIGLMPNLAHGNCLGVGGFRTSSTRHTSTLHHNLHCIG